MSAEIPPDLRSPIKNLEKQAFELLAKEQYNMARGIYRIIYDTLHDRQFTEKRRIHLGAPLHMIGLSFLLEGLSESAFEYFSSLT